MVKDMERTAAVEDTALKAQEGFSATLTPSDFADKSIIPSRYMGASVGSCHDLCKYGMKRDLNKEQKDSSRQNSQNKSRDTKNMKRGPGFATMMKKEFSSPEAFDSQKCSAFLAQGRKFSLLSKVYASPSTEGMSLKASKMKPLRESPKVGTIKCSSKVRELSNLGTILNVRSDSHGKSRIESVVKRRISKDTSKPPFSSSPQVRVAKIDSKAGGFYKKRNVMHLRSPNKTETPELEQKGLFASNPDTGIKSVTCMSMERAIQVRRLDLSNKAKNLKRCQSDSMTARLPSSLEKRTLRSTRSGIHRNPSSLSMSASTKTRDLRLVQNGSLIRQSSLRRLRVQTMPVNATHKEEKDSSQNSNIGAKGQVLDLSEESKVHTTKRVKKRIQETIYMPPVKLKFQRGKSVAIQDQKSSPWKLVLSRGRILSEPQHALGVTRLRSFKRSGIVDDVLKGRTSHEKIVLRHQDVVEHKTIQNSFNNVIEETASKLAETRKSKVKALVGAFETVISLQSH